MSAVFNERTVEHEPGESCPVCGRRTVYYVGTYVLHGNPYTPASDTEVEHTYECHHPPCRHTWSRVV